MKPEAKVPRLAELTDVRATSFRPIQVSENGFIVTDNGVMGKGTHKLKFDSSFPVY